MQNKNTIKDEIENVTVLGGLVKTYEEVYMLKMYKTRKSIIKAREYYKRLLSLYESMKQAYKNERLWATQKDTKKQVGLISDKTKKHVSVLITGNDKFAGGINKKVFTKFMENNESQHPDLVVIGKIGKSLMVQLAGTVKYTYFDVEERFGMSNSKQLEPVMKHLMEYQDVRVFYGEFENILQQEAMSVSITGEMDVLRNKNETVNIAEGGEYYLVEPSPVELLTFFETQIFASLFNRGIEESVLAQIGSRVASLEESTYAIDKRLRLLKYMALRNSKRLRNKKQQDLLVGVHYWSH